MKRAALMLVLLFVSEANALTAKEKEHLTLLIQDVEILMHDARNIEDRFSSQSDAKRFNYDALISDLEVVKNGIERRVTEKSSQPVNFKSIKADF